MKKLKYLLCFALIFICSFSFVGCDKNNNSNVNNEEKNELTTFEVLKIVYDKTFEAVNSNNENTGLSFATDSGLNYYQSCVFSGLIALKELYSFENLKDGKVFCGNTLSASPANKVEKIYVENNSNLNLHEFKVYILCSKLNYSLNNLNCILYYYDISYNETTKEILLSCKIQKSNKIETFDSQYYTFNFNSSDNMFSVYSYYMTKDFNFEDNQNSTLVSNLKTSIMNYNFISYNTLSKMKIDFGALESDYLSLDNSNVQTTIINDLKEFKEIDNFVFELESATNATENLSENFLRFINLEQITNYDEFLPSKKTEDEA